MAYTVKKLSNLSGISVRTLHFYEELGLLKPAYYGSNGYRYYEAQELLQLQQILFFKELGLTLKQIQKILIGKILKKRPSVSMAPSPSVSMKDTPLDPLKFKI